VAACYTEDGKLMPPGVDVVSGRAGISAVFSSVYKSGITEIVLHTDEVTAHGVDWAVERSHYTFKASDGSVADVGKYVVVWRRVGDKWLLYTDIFNTNNAAPGAEKKQADLTSQIIAANAIWMKKFVAKDAKALSECYTTDAKLMPPGADVVTGREGVAAVLGAVMKGVGSIVLHTDEVVGQTADTATERGHFTMKTATGKVADIGKYIVLWRQVGGQWLLHFDCFNSNGAADESKVDLVASAKASNATWMRCFASKDAKALSECYTTDAKLMPPGADVVTGREGIAAVFGSVMKGVATIDLETFEVLPGGADQAIERGGYTFKAGDGKVLDVGKYVVIWKIIEGKFFLFMDIFNTSKTA